MSNSNAVPVEEMMSFLHKISPLRRMVNCPGLDETFAFLKQRHKDIVIHEYPSGKSYGDWVSPPSWEVTTAYLKDQHGNVIVSLDDHFLFVADYSEPIDGWFSKAEIESHLRTREDRPDAFLLEHRNAYDFHLVDWRISLPFNIWSKLSDHEKYHIKIDTLVKENPLKLAEWFIPGESKETICVCAHIDELCNDDLSACAVALELMRYIENIPNRKYSYQMLLGPELFSTLFFIHDNPEKIDNTIAMLNLETLGAGDDLCLKKALKDGVPFERALRLAINEKELAFTEYNFFEAIGNDERVYAWPTIDIPGVSLQRYPYYQYHTSEDTVDVLSPELMQESLEICCSFVNILEEDFVVEYAGLLPPWLSKRKLYFDSINEKNKFHKFNNILLYNIDGIKPMSELAELSGLTFNEVKNYLHSFIESGVLKIK